MVSLLVASFVVALSAAAPQSPAGSPAASVVIDVPVRGELQQLDLGDGSRAIGRVESIDADTFTFRTLAGVVMNVERSQVKSLGVAQGTIVEGEFWPADSNPTRLFFAPTGRSLRKGEAYLGVYEILLPFVQYGITDDISIGGGTPLVFGGGEVPFWITPKVRVVKSRAADVAVGVLHFMNVGDANLGIAYAVTTAGTGDSAVTGGVGYAYLNTADDADDDGSMVAMIGAEHRLSRRLKFVTENYFFDGGGIASAGIRFLGERLSVDLGLFSPLGADQFVAAPIINFVWKF